VGSQIYSDSPTDERKPLNGFVKKFGQNPAELLSIRAVVIVYMEVGKGA
jgi:hypothetical protein